MPTPLYRPALKQSWHFAKNHRSLLVFALFAALLGQLGLFELLEKANFIGYVASDAPAGVRLSFGEWLASLKSVWLVFFARPFGFDYATLLIWFAVLFIGLAAALTLVSVSSQGALVYAAAAFDIRKKNFEKISDAWNAGVTHFWKILALNIIRRSAILILGLALGWSIYLSGTDAGWFNTASFFIFMTLGVIFAAIVSFVCMYAVGYVVVEEYTILQSLKLGWRLFTLHWLVSLEMAFIMIFLNVLAVFVAFFAFLFFLFPAVLFWIAAVAFTSPVLITAGFVVSGTFFVASLMYIASFLTMFSTHAWTYLFLKMHREGVVSRVFHWLRA